MSDKVKQDPIGTVERLLGVAPDLPSWGVADHAQRAKALATWLSARDLAGQQLTDGDRGYLDRMRRRVGTLHAVGEELAAGYGLRVLKGPRIAAYYPEGLLRQSGDVDLLTPDAASLWAAALDLRTRFGAVLQCLSLLEDGPGPLHLGVSMKWPAEEPHMDKPMGADLNTCAFCGDLKTVPVRVLPPDDEDLCGLFSVAEERFQRKYRIKDLLDFTVLAEAAEQRLGDALVDTVCGHADQLALAPELRSLAKKTGSWNGLSSRWRSVVEELRPLAREEKSLRVPGRPGLHRLRSGLLVNPVPSGEAELRIVRKDDLELAVTPLGICLLVDNPVISGDTWQRAVDISRQLARESS